MVDSKNKDINKTKDKKIEDIKKIKDEKEINTTDDEVKDTSDEKSKVIEELALILNVPIEKVEEVLIELDFDVENLLDKENLLGFVREVFDVDSNVDLLNIDGIKEKLSSIENTINLNVDESNQELNLDLGNKYLKENTKVEDKIQNTNDEIDLDNNEVVEVINLSTKEEIPKDEIILNEDAEINTDNVVKNITKEVSNASEANFSQENFNQETNDSEFDFLNDNNDISKISNNQIVSEGTFENVLINKTSLRSNYKNINNTEVIEQIMNKFKVDIGENTSSIRITLHPETLGDVSLKVVTENGIVTAQFIAENESVKEIIESGFQDLKQMLNEQGIEISSLSVSVEQQNQNDDNNNLFEGNKKSSKRIENILSSQGDIVEEKSIDNYELDVHDASVNYTA